MRAPAGFRALLAAQFLGALNDNIFKFVVSLIAVQQLAGASGGAGYVSLAGALFILPFILFAPLAGYLADRFSKTVILRATTLLECAILLVAASFLAQASPAGLLAAVFVMGVQSTLFSPAKYGILPEILPAEELSAGNGYIQFWTFLAILVGTAVAGPIMEFLGSRVLWIGMGMATLSLISFGFSWKIPYVSPAQPDKPFTLNGLSLLFASLRTIGAKRELALAVGAAAFFWFAGTLVQLNTLLYAAQILHTGGLGTGMLVTLLALGIGLGSLTAGAASAHKIELGLVPAGAIGIALCAFGLGAAPHSVATAAAWMFGLGLSAGLYIVPINAFIQHASPPETRGSTLAAASLITSSAMVLASVALWVLKDILGLNAAQVFLAAGALSVLAAVIIVRVMPEIFVRLINFVLTHTLYRLKVSGQANIPASGGALLVCNHASYVDPSILLAAIDRPIRFIMARPIYNARFIHPVARAMRCIPISPADSPREILEALHTARRAVENGDLVCIFAEGAHSQTGQLLPFKRGLAHLMKDLKEPVIPVYLDQVWGSIFSYRDGRYFWKKPEEIPYPVTVCFGKPMPAAATLDDVRRAVQELSAQAFAYRREAHKLLHAGFIRQAKRRLLRPCMADSTGVRLNYLQALTAAIALSERFKKLPAPTRMIGVLLPASAGGALANLALLMAGRIPVNLNFTASRDALETVKGQCNLETILTSQKFLDKLGWEKDASMQRLEDIRATIGPLKRFSCFLGAAVVPAWWLQHMVLREKALPGDPATVMFSSGSTGQPKGVMLTHANIASNVEAVYDVFRLRQNDVVMGTLPLFHSFGLTGTLWLPLLAGASVVYHPNPLDASTIGKLIAEHRATFLLSTPTFLTAYTRKCAPEQLRSLRHVVVGAEKLRAGIADAFTEKFGVTLYEGYGATELSPFAAVNVPDPRRPDVPQSGRKPGTIGRPLPGVAVRIVDPQTLEPVPAGADGLLLVKGPNVMHGYLNNPEKTKQVVQDGWYNTGDIARTDEDGFITITDRLSRFSKIGGEMVPHVRVEEALEQAIGAKERCCAVSSVLDDKKGERLVVLHTVDVDAEAARKQLAAEGLPSLWIPKAEDFHRIEALPLLGSGKLDLKKVKETAVALAAAAPKE